MCVCAVILSCDWTEMCVCAVMISCNWTELCLCAVIISCNWIELCLCAVIISCNWTELCLCAVIISCNWTELQGYSMRMIVVLSDCWCYVFENEAYSLNFQADQRATQDLGEEHDGDWEPHSLLGDETHQCERHFVFLCSFNISDTMLLSSPPPQTLLGDLFFM